MSKAECKCKCSRPVNSEREFEESATPPSCVCMHSPAGCKFTKGSSSPLTVLWEVIIAREKGGRVTKRGSNINIYIYIFCFLNWTLLPCADQARCSLATVSGCGWIRQHFRFLTVTDETQTGFFFRFSGIGWASVMPPRPPSVVAAESDRGGEGLHGDGKHLKQRCPTMRLFLRHSELSNLSSLCCFSRRSASGLKSGGGRRAEVMWSVRGRKGGRQSAVPVLVKTLLARWGQLISVAMAAINWSGNCADLWS